MLFDYTILLLTAIATTAIGALPFGLVNLNIINVSLEQGNQPALRVARGASFVEVVFGLTAILGGGMFYQYIEGNSTISYITMGFLIAGGIFFLVRKQGPVNNGKTRFSGFWKGAFLNLVSIQVFLFWVLAIAYLSSRQFITFDPISILVFITGIWLGKMSVLRLYTSLSNKMLSKSRIISNNINRIIGLVLFGMAMVQVIKL